MPPTQRAWFCRRRKGRPPSTPPRPISPFRQPPISSLCCGNCGSACWACSRPASRPRAGDPHLSPAQTHTLATPRADQPPPAAAAADAIFQDPDTGLVFTSNFQLYKSDGRGITFRVAIPDGVQSYTAYDAVIQMVVPNDVGWAGLAWGGSMPKNPILVAWRGSSNNVVLSSRWATCVPPFPVPSKIHTNRTCSGHVMPTDYSGATYTLFKSGTKSNGTHWQFTALCKGCTAWDAGSGSMRYLSPRGGNRLAFAYSPSKPSSVNSPSSTIPIHDVHGYWNHDFTAAANAGFDAAVSRLTA